DLRRRDSLATLRRMRTGLPPSTRRRAGVLALASACALVLAACHHAPPPPSNATPEKAVATSLRLTATGDFDGLMKNRLPPADYTRWRSEWDAAHARPGATSAMQDQQFAQIMRMLTEPGAEGHGHARPECVDRLDQSHGFQ